MSTDNPNYKTVLVSDLIPYARNSRTHSDVQVNKIASSIKEFGFLNPVLIDKDNGIIAGHGRVMAAQKLGLKEVPVLQIGHLSDTQKRAYIIADNRLALDAGWDDEMLRVEFAELADNGFNLELTGFEIGEIESLEPEIIAEGLTDEDEVPDAPTVAVTVLGDVWLCGNHRVMCGDSINGDSIEKLMNGEKAQLLHADPPYGMGKEKDGVENDNLYANKLDAFQMDWWAGFRPFIENNGSVYIWGNAPDLWRLWYKGGLADSERMTFRNVITWDKYIGNVKPTVIEMMRSYCKYREDCLFFMLGEQGFNNNADNYWEGFEPIRAYLETEMNKCGGTKNWKDALGNQMGGHYFTKSQWSFPTKDAYSKLQSYAKGEAFKREYDELKQEFYATRAYFDNTHDNMTDVWSFGRVTGEERHGHATPKPVEMMERVMKSSLPKGGLCVEPFGGSGSTLMGAEKTGRRCYTMEITPAYCDVIVKRWQSFTGKEATLESTGEKFNVKTTASTN